MIRPRSAWKLRWRVRRRVASDGPRRPLSRWRRRWQREEAREPRRRAPGSSRRFGDEPSRDPLFILDAALEAVERDVVASPPERGGALLGLRGRAVVTDFAFDESALTTTATYQPSRDLTAHVKQIEARTPLQFKGILHSHPGQLDRPSTQDAYELQVGLELNPHLARYLVPIITLGEGGSREHELTVNGGKLSCYVASRTRDGGIVVRRQPVTEVPLSRHVRVVAAAYGGDAPPEVFVTDFAGVQMLAAKVDIDAGDELLFLTSELYPAFPPLLLVTLAGGQTRQVQLAWDLELPPDERLVASVRTVLRGRPPFRSGFGPQPRGPILTEDAARADRAGWTPLFEPIAQALSTREDRISRQSSLAPISDTTAIIIAGAGSVGATAAEYFVRSGVRSISVVDPERVEAANLSRSPYELQDVGNLKVNALERILLQIEPELAYQALADELQACDRAGLLKRAQGAALLFAATDDPGAQRLANAIAYGSGTPAVFAALYAGAQGGEVIFTRPEVTPCYLCATTSRHSLMESDAVEPEHDYGTGRLTGEAAISADIHHLTTAAVKIALSLIATEESQLRRDVDGLVADGLTYLTLSMVSDYWFYPDVFRGVPNQRAYQSLWLAPKRLDDCTVCGAAENRVDPANAETGGPTLESLQRVAEARRRRRGDDVEPNS